MTTEHRASPSSAPTDPPLARDARLTLRTRHRRPPRDLRRDELRATASTRLAGAVVDEERVLLAAVRVAPRDLGVEREQRFDVRVQRLTNRSMQARDVGARERRRRRRRVQLRDETRLVAV